MANIDLSVIIPSKNNKKKISKIICDVASELENIETEFIIIDMNSSDKSVITALDTLKKNNLRGYVIQNGSGNVSSALNTGIYRSNGKYISFLFMNRLYKNYLSDFFCMADKNNADFVFYANEEAKAKLTLKDILRDKSKNKDPYPSDSIWLLCELLKSDIYFDFNTVMFRREFVLDKGIKFYEDFNYGYAEAFIYNMLLNSPKIACCETKPVYDNINSSANDEAVPNTSCYGRIDSMIRIYENSVSLHPDNKYLNDLFEYRKLPSVVMSVVRILTKEEFSYAAIKRSFKQKGYNKLLKTSHMTPHELRREIIIWNTFPWLYKP